MMLKTFHVLIGHLAVGISDLLLPGGIREGFVEEAREASQEKSTRKPSMAEEDRAEVVKRQRA